jgi:tetratricopeptide (TPR) repeat protein
MVRSLLACLVLWMAQLSVLSVAAAQTTPPEQPVQDSEAEARRLYAEGKVEYAQGRFVEAIELFERSYALSSAPALLFNMAQAHRLAGPEHCAEALALYKSYLEALPEAENRREVEERITELDACAKPPLPAATAEPAVSSSEATGLPHVTDLTVPPPPAPLGTPAKEQKAGRRTGSLGPILLASAAAASLITGGVLYARAHDKYGEAERECPCYPGTFTKWQRLTNLSYALFAVGGATLGGSVSWWVLATRRSQGSQAMLGLSARF